MMMMMLKTDTSN